MRSADFYVDMHPSQAALSWCISVQECAMYASWPASALLHWPEERGVDGKLVFRGPRCANDPPCHACSQIQQRTWSIVVLAGSRWGFARAVPALSSPTTWAAPTIMGPASTRQQGSWMPASIRFILVHYSITFSGHGLF